MPEVHLPHLDDDEEEAPGSSVPGHPVDSADETSRPSPRFRMPRLPKLLLEVILISSGVFLGLAGEQWRESRHKNELAQVALRGLRSELETNRKEIAAHKNYHVTKRKDLEDFLKADPKQRLKTKVDIEGIQIVIFEHAAWDLSLANGSLANIDPALAASLAHAYNTQQFYERLSQGFTESLYLHPPTSRENKESFYGALSIYYSDIVIDDAKLMAMYDDLIPKIDRQLQH